MSPACIHSVWQLPVVFSSPGTCQWRRPHWKCIAASWNACHNIWPKDQISDRLVDVGWGPYHFYLKIVSISGHRFWMVLASPRRRKSWFPIHPRKMGIVRRTARLKMIENEQRTAGWILVFCLKIHPAAIAEVMTLSWTMQPSQPCDFGSAQPPLVAERLPLAMPMLYRWCIDTKPATIFMVAVLKCRIDLPWQIAWDS